MKRTIAGIAYYIENDVIVCTISGMNVGTNDLMERIPARSKPPNLELDLSHQD
jgi:hypothetical protein